MKECFETTDYLVGFIPLVLGIISGMFMNKNAGQTIPARPPGFVFGIVWIILYIFMGIAWMHARREDAVKSDIMFGILTALLFLWVIVYNTDKKNALYILLAIFMVTLMTVFFCSSVSNLAKYLTIPLLAWVTFALMLNFEEVNRTKMNLSC